MPAFTQWQSSEAFSQSPASPTVGQTFQHSALDALRSHAWRRSPTDYPDGLLGTITSRRNDRIMGSVTRMNQRSYRRGVHKGERIDRGDYFWPEEFGLYSGLQQQDTGERWAPRGSQPVHIVNDGKPGPQNVPSGFDIPRDAAIDLQRRSQLARQRPTWRL